MQKEIKDEPKDERNEDAIEEVKVAGVEEQISLKKDFSTCSAESLDHEAENQEVELKEGGSSDEEWEQQVEDKEESKPPAAAEPQKETGSPTKQTTPTKQESHIQHEEEKAPAKAEFVEPQFPSREWMYRWKETLLLGNVKQCI
jgi:cell division septation protein DedD